MFTPVCISSRLIKMKLLGYVFMALICIIPPRPFITGLEDLIAGGVTSSLRSPTGGNGSAGAGGRGVGYGAGHGPRPQALCRHLVEVPEGTKRPV